MHIGREEYYLVEVAEVHVTLICQTWDGGGSFNASKLVGVTGRLRTSTIGLDQPSRVASDTP